jgi:hypothetical protein
MNYLLRLLGLDALSDVRTIDAVHWHAARDVPPWLLYLVLGGGVLLAAVNLLPFIRMRLVTRIVTTALRLGMVALLVALLFQTGAQVRLKLNEKQRWLALVDDSGSMSIADAGGKTRFAAACADLERLRRGVSGRVIFASGAFSGGAVPPEAGSGPTYIERVVTREALNRGPMDRLLLLTDGRDVEGRDFTRLGRELQARGIALDVRVYGSQETPRYNFVTAEPERSVIRLGEELVVNVSVAGSGREGGMRFTLSEDGKPVKTRDVGREDLRWFQIAHRPEVTGKHRYSVAVADQDAPPGGQASTFVAEVLDAKIKVLLIEGVPRFEFKLMKAAVEIDPLVSLTTICHMPGGGLYIQGAPEHARPEEGLINSQADLYKYDVVILRDVPRSLFRSEGDTSENRMQLLVSFVQKRGGGLMCFGGKDVYRGGGYQDSALAEIIPFDMSDHFSKDAQFPGLFFPIVVNGLYDHPLLRFFTQPGQSRERWNALRELDGCNNVGRFKPLATPLLTRQVKLRNSKGEMEPREVPVLAYQAVGDGKVIASSANTFWRWQLQPEFDDPPLQQLMANMIRYLAPDPQRRAESANVSLVNRCPQVGQEAILFTELRDKNYDPVRRAALVVTVTAPDGRVSRLFPTDLPEQPGYYEYRVPLDAAGTYEVTTEYGKMRRTKTFVAGASGSEFANVAADPDGMAKLAAAAGGRVIQSPDAWLQPADTTPASRPAVRDLQVWNSPLALILFLLLVSIDCFVRKRQGLV